MSSDTTLASGRNIAGGLIGLMLGTIVFGGAALGASSFWEKRTKAELRKGWNLVPVSAAGRDLAPGEVLQKADVSSVQVPDQFVTTSVVQASASSYVVGRELNVPVAKGTPLRYSFFRTAAGLSPSTDVELFLACSAEAKSRGLSPRERTSADIRARVVAGGGR